MFLSLKQQITTTKISETRLTGDLALRASLYFVASNVVLAFQP
jgi:hypothetical protein